MIHDQRLKAVLLRHNYKSTFVRQSVYARLMEITVPITNISLVNSINTIDKVSVYRTIKLFEEIGIVHRVWTGFRSKIELSDNFSPHHHHFSCQTCGTIISFKHQSIETAVHEVESKLGVVINSHVVELNGMCEKCIKNS